MTNLRKRLSSQRRNKKANEREKEGDVDRPSKEGPKRPPMKHTPSMNDLLTDVVVKTERGADGRIQRVTRRRVLFVLGALLGFFLAFFFVVNEDPRYSSVRSWAEELALRMTELDLAKYLPEKLIFEDIFGNFSSSLFPSFDSPDDAAPGLQFRQLGVQPKYPIVMVPGIISTGLESWSMSNCSRRYFRNRLWGTTTMFRAVLLDKQCWVQQMRLDPMTGLDPPGAKLRAAQGLDAADYFVSGYWIWGKIIENFGAIGYDNNNMHFAAYDWRLSYPNLEKRDHYFTKLKNTMEMSLKINGRKSVVICHSMGSSVYLYFLKWVEHPKGGDGGPTWVNDHIHSVVHIAGAILGALKTMPSLISGEQRETVQPLANYVLERFFSKWERAQLFRNWGGLASLIPKGGDTIWGNHQSAPDDNENNEQVSLGQFFLFPEGSAIGRNLTVSESIDLLLNSTDESFRNQFQSAYRYGLARDLDEMNPDDPTTWSNPLESQLPKAPSMKMYCLYGYGIPTERGYHYTQSDIQSTTLHNPVAATTTKATATANVTESMVQVPKFFVNVNIDIPDQQTKDGIRNADGDGSVPLLSLGYMCAEGWRKPLYNPSGLKVVTREFLHSPVTMIEDIRGGASTGEHVDILGNTAVMEDLLKIVSDHEVDTVDDRIESKILEFAKKVNL